MAANPVIEKRNLLYIFGYPNPANLFVRVAISGEVKVSADDGNGMPVNVILEAADPIFGPKVYDLLTYAPIDGWRHSPTLLKAVVQGWLYVDVPAGPVPEPPVIPEEDCCTLAILKPPDLQVGDLVVYDGTAFVRLPTSATPGDVLTSHGLGVPPTFESPGTGNVQGPGSSTNNAITRWDGTTGLLLKDSNVLIDDAGLLTLPTSLVFTGGGAPSVSASGTSKQYFDSGTNRQRLSMNGVSFSDIITRADVFTSGTAGVVPASGGGSTNFLRADGSWAPAGITGSGANQRVALWSGASTLTSNAGLTFDGRLFALTESGVDPEFTITAASSANVAIFRVEDSTTSQTGFQRRGQTSPNAGGAFFPGGGLFLTQGHFRLVAYTETGAFTPEVISFWAGASSDPTTGTVAERMRIRGSDGFVGIGTNNPLNHFHVEHSGTDGVARIVNTNTSGFSSIDFYMNAGTQRFSFGYAGAAFGDLTGRGYFYSTNSDLVIQVQDGAVTALRPSVIFGSTSTKFNSRQRAIDVEFDTQGATNTLFVQASTDRVGMNTSSPTRLLDVRGTVAIGQGGNNGDDLDITRNVNGPVDMCITNPNAGSAARAIYIMQNNQLNGFVSWEVHSSGWATAGLSAPSQFFFNTGVDLTGGVLFLTQANAPFRFATNSTFLASASAERLTIGGTSMVFNNSSANYDIQFKTQGNSNTLFVQASTDRVGIGTNGPIAKLDVRGDGWFESTTFGSLSSVCVTADAGAQLAVTGHALTSGFWSSFITLSEATIPSLPTATWTFAQERTSTDPAAYTADLVLYGPGFFTLGSGSEYLRITNHGHVASLVEIVDPTDFKFTNANLISDVDKTGSLGTSTTRWGLVATARSEYTVETVAFNANITLDFTTETYQDIAVTGAITFATTHLAKGRSISIRLVADGGGPYNLTFPGGWVFLNSAPTSLAASKTAILSLFAYGNSDATVVAAYGVQS